MNSEEKNTPYGQWIQQDIIGPIEHRFVNQTMEIGTDDLIRERTIGTPLGSWFYNNINETRVCDLWFSVFFNCYRFVPKGCRGCWKCVVTPRNLREFFLLLDLQEKQAEEDGTNSKIGMETRPYAFGNYSSFWYMPLTDDFTIKRVGEAYDFWKKIKDQIHAVIPDIKVILKRGCTEMEKFTLETYGVTTDRYDEVAEKLGWNEKEDSIADKFAPSPEMEDKHLRKVEYAYKKQKMVRWAFDRGDETYLEFTGGKSLASPIFTYHDKDLKQFVR